MLINPYAKFSSTALKEYNEEDVIKETKLKIVEDSKIDLNKISEDILRKNIEKILVENFSQSDEKTILKIQDIVVNDILRYGILQKYIDDKTITDIRVTRYDKIFIKRNGKWILTSDSFKTAEDFESYIRFCALKNNSTVNYENPILIFSDRKNLLRLEAGINPVNINSASLVIRIHRENTNTTLEELYTKTNMLNKKQYLILKDIASKKNNVVICGKGRKW